MAKRKAPVPKNLNKLPAPLRKYWKSPAGQRRIAAAKRRKK